MTPGRMLREIFEHTAKEPLSQNTPNTTPVFRLGAAMPEFAAEVSALLVEQGETALAESVADLLGLRPMPLLCRILRDRLHHT